MKELDPNDLRIERYRAPKQGTWGGEGTCVRVTHVPTGLKAESCNGRSVHQNRKIATAELTETVYATSEEAQKIVPDPEEKLTGDYRMREHKQWLRPPLAVLQVQVVKDSGNGKVYSWRDGTVLDWHWIVR